MNDFNPLDYGEPVEKGQDQEFNPLEYGEPVEAAQVDSGISDVDDVPEWAQRHPNLYGMYGVGKTLLEEGVSPIIEGAATVAGGLVGSPILGSSMGYAAGKQATDIFEEAYAKLGGEEGKKRTIAGELKRVGKDVATGVALGKGMQVAGAPIQAMKSGISTTLRGTKKLTEFVPQLNKVGKYMFDDLPKRLYGSAANVPISKPWIKELPGREISKRTAVIEEGLKERVPLSSLGQVKAKRLEKEVKQAVDEAIDLLSTDPNKKIKTVDFVNKGLKQAYVRAKSGSTPIADKQSIDRVKAELLERPDEITFKEANKIKRDIWKKSNWGEATDTATKAAHKDVGREVNKLIIDEYPEIKSLNETDAARIGLKDVIEKSVASQANKPLVEFSTKYMVVHPKMWPVAVWNSTVGHPRIKASIALALAKANPEKYSRLVYPELPAGYSAAKEIVEEGVYRYAPKSTLTKATRPRTLKPKLRPAHKQIPVKKLYSYAEKEEAQRVKELEKIFKEQGKKSLPLSKPKETYVKATRPKKVEDMLSGLNGLK